MAQDRNNEVRCQYNPKIIGISGSPPFSSKHMELEKEENMCTQTTYNTRYRSQASQKVQSDD